jgi:tRNA threonylcarbamoyladenosine biosynthesis protein TsaE
MSEIVFDAKDETDTDRFAAAVANALPPGSTIALCGTLGAGKTRFVQGLAAACGVARDEVVSPTFVLLQQYRGTRTINHLDAYRIRDEDEFRELGIDELLDSDAITIIEWADRVPDCLPDDYIQITIDVTGPNSRRFTLTPVGTGFDELRASIRLPT